jgi:hypothetical protein
MSGNRVVTRLGNSLVMAMRSNGWITSHKSYDRLGNRFVRKIKREMLGKKYGRWKLLMQPFHGCTTDKLHTADKLLKV